MPDPLVLAQVLVADDEALVRSTLTKFLNSLGVSDVIEARNGEEAIRQARAHSSTLDLILLDIKMPVKDGLKALEEIRGFLPKTKIAILTGYPFYGEAATAVQKWGVVDFIVKPVDLDYLKRIVKTLLPL